MIVAMQRSISQQADWDDPKGDLFKQSENIVSIPHNYWLSLESFLASVSGPNGNQEALSQFPSREDPKRDWQHPPGTLVSAHLCISSIYVSL